MFETGSNMVRIGFDGKMQALGQYALGLVFCHQALRTMLDSIRQVVTKMLRGYRCALFESIEHRGRCSVEKYHQLQCGNSLGVPNFASEVICDKGGHDVQN